MLSSSSSNSSSSSSPALALYVSNNLNDQSKIQTSFRINNHAIVHRVQKVINFKEAIIFAFLGLLRDQNKVNCYASVTGAKKNHSTGNIFLP